MWESKAREILPSELDLMARAEKFYMKKQKESGMITPQPFAYCYYSGGLLVYSAFGVNSKMLADKLGIEIPEQEAR